MKRCRFCDHYGRTDTGEEICKKYVAYLGDENDIPCGGIEVTIGAAALLVAVGAILLMSLLFTIG